MSAGLKERPEPQLTDGFHLVIGALKLNDIDTIFGVPGIPIADLTRMAQTEGMRVDQQRLDRLGYSHSTSRALRC